MTDDAGATATRPSTPAAVAEGLLLAALVAAPWPYGCSGDGARYLLVAVLLLAGAAWAAAAALSGRDLPALGLPAVGLPALGLVQILLGWSATPVWTGEAVLVLAAMLAALLFWSERSGDPLPAQRLAGAVLLTCGAQAVFGAAQWSIAPGRIYGRETPIVTTPFGSFVNHNHFAGLLEMGVILSAGMALGHARRAGGASPGSIALGGLSLGLGAAHLASRSRGGLVALAGGLFLLGLLWSWRPEGVSKARAGMAGLAALLILTFGLTVIPSTTRQHLASVLHGPSDLSGEYRVDIAGATLRLALAHPLAGSGIGGYADGVPPYKVGHGGVRATHAESDVLEFLAEGGLIGLALAAWLSLGILLGFFDRLSHGHDPFRKGIAVGALAAAGTLLVHSLIDFNLRVPSNALVFASLLGLAAAPAAPRPETQRVGGRRASMGLALVLTSLAGLAAWRAAGAVALASALVPADRQLRIAALDAKLARHPYLAEGYRARGLAWRDVAWASGGLGAGRIARAEADLARALRLRPLWGEAWADLGWVRWQRGDLPGAAEAMDRAARLDPTHWAIGLSRAEFLARTEGPAAAVGELRRLRAADPQWTREQAVAAGKRWTSDPALLAGF